MSSSSSTLQVRARKWGAVVLVVLGLCALAAALLWYGHSFYELDVEARVDHRQFRALSPGGPIGHGYGVFGTALMITNLLYLARRRFARARLGSMRTWLNIHVLSGLFGSMLVAFHSAFQLRSPIATLTSISLGLVVSTGLIGRYIYSLAPEPNHAALKACLLELDVLANGLGSRIADSLRALPAASTPRRAGLRASIALVPRWFSEARARRTVVHALASPVVHDAARSRAERRQLGRLARDTARLATEPVRTLAGESLLRSWRGLHRFFALLMIASVSVHIIVAWAFGFRWVFSE